MSKSRLGVGKIFVKASSALFVVGRFS
jgi:hypothetical protein